MSIPHIYLTAAGASATSSPPICSRSLQSGNLSDTKEHIRERLNMHVKKRIQGQDIIPQYTVPSSTVYSSTSHPFLMSTASGAMPPMVVIANSLISVASDYSKNANRTVSIPQIEQQMYKNKQLPKKLIKKKKTNSSKKNVRQVDANQQAENLILNTKFSDESNDYHERNERASNFMNGSISPSSNNLNNGDTSPVLPDKPDQRLNNTLDILSVVLSAKKCALMHDPYVIQFISSIR